MTEEQAKKFIDAVESIGNALGAIAFISWIAFGFHACATLLHR